MAPLKVVCLISGGKDSLFSTLHCLENGHDVVALANLHPPYHASGDAVDDLDSYMYQTIGHTVIPLYEKALGLPLYRHEISGTHVNQYKSYGPTSTAAVNHEDETEALTPLLQKVKASHPDVNAVSTGAIFSDYQRTRVESVTLRLGLTPLAYLWQWPNLPPHSQSSLLKDMAAVGQDSRIVKVASGGLDESFLWENVADPRTISRLEKGAGRFGSPDDGAVLGEGGEYETLAIAGPVPLWKARIVVDESDNQVVPSGAGAAYLRIPEPRLEPLSLATESIANLRTPPLLEDRFKTLLETLKDYAGSVEVSSNSKDENTSDGAISTTVASSSHVFLPNLTGAGATPADQTKTIMEHAMRSLQRHAHSATDVAYTSIILRDMADFASINTVYGSYFSHPNPPARVTIASAAVLPIDKHVMISLTSVKRQDPTFRQGLHVQSRSYWAPANIGPYSQAISVPLDDDPGLEGCSLVYIAGQIPLVPQTMELPTFQDNEGADSFAKQTVLALQHAVRIGRAMKVKRWACAIVFITSSSPEESRFRSNVARHAWKGLHRLDDLAAEESTSDQEAESFDVWDVRLGNARQSDTRLSMGGLLFGNHIAGQDSTLHVIQVDALPRGASVEWATYGLTAASCLTPEILHFEQLLQTFNRTE